MLYPKMVIVCVLLLAALNTVQCRVAQENNNNNNNNNHRLLLGDGDDDDPLINESAAPTASPPTSDDDPAVPLTGKCSSCQDRETSKQLKREIVRNEILNRLGMTHPPNVTGIVSKSKHLIKQFLNRYKHELHDHSNYQGDDPSSSINFPGFSGTVIDNEEDDHFQTRVINVLSSEIPESINLPQEFKSNPGFIYFNLKTDPLRYNWQELSKADLRIHLPHAPTLQDNLATVKISYVSPIKNSDNFELRNAHKVTYKLTPQHGGWIDIKVWDIVMMWLKHPQENYGFVVTVSTNTLDNLEIFDENTLIPYLQMDIRETSSNNRRKRTLSKVCNEETDSTTTNCCLWPLVIDFEKEYGWDFILYPPKYEANFCYGECSLGVTPEYVHTHLMLQNQRPKAGLSPCCTPKKMSGVTMMYFDGEGHIILGKIPKMKVERCGCA